MRDITTNEPVAENVGHPAGPAPARAGRAPAGGRPGDKARAAWQPIVAKAVQHYRDYLKVLADRGLAADLRSKGDASDVVQETFAEVYREYHRFEGLSDEAFKALLVRMMLNNLKSFTRRYRGSLKRDVAREVSLSGLRDDESGLQVADTEVSPGECLSAKEELRRLHLQLDRLAERDRLAVTWRARDGCTYREIGDRLGCSPVAARKLWLRVVDRLRRNLSASSN